MQHSQQPQRPRLTRRQREILRRRRRRETIRSVALLALVAVAVVAAVVLALRPRNDVQNVIARRPGDPTDAPATTAAVMETDAPAATDAPAVTDAPEAQNTSAAQTLEATDAVMTTDAPSATDVPSETDEPATQAPEATAAPETTVAVYGSASDGLRSVRFRVTGDIMVTEEQLEFAQKAGAENNTYFFHPQLLMIYESLRDADFTIGNLETTIGSYKGKAYSGYPMFNSPETLLNALRDCGYDFFTLANNHMLDRWFDGMKNTVNAVEKFGFAHVGAYRTQEERNTPVIVEINGIKFGFVAYTHSTNTVENSCDPAAKEYGVPYLQTADIAGDIQRLRDAGAEVVIALPHWGEEYVLAPDSQQQKYATILAEAGADVILGSHSHTVQPMGYTTVTDSSGKTRDVFTIFSLGNFLSTHTKQYTDAGVILEFTIQEQADGTFKCENIGYIPTYCWIHDDNVQVISSAKYLNNPPDGMDSKAYARMREAYSEVTSQLGLQYRVLEE